MGKDTEKAKRRLPIRRTPEGRQAHRRMQDAADSFAMAARACREDKPQTALEHAERGRDQVREAVKLATDPQADRSSASAEAHAS